MDMLTVELNTPLDIGDKVTIKNRFMKSAMSEAMGTLLSRDGRRSGKKGLSGPV